MDEATPEELAELPLIGAVQPRSPSDRAQRRWKVKSPAGPDLMISCAEYPGEMRWWVSEFVVVYGSTPLDAARKYYKSASRVARDQLKIARAEMKRLKVLAVQPEPAPVERTPVERARELAKRERIPFGAALERIHTEREARAEMAKRARAAELAKAHNVPFRTAMWRINAGLWS